MQKICNAFVEVISSPMRQFDYPISLRSDAMSAFVCFFKVGKYMVSRFQRNAKSQLSGNLGSFHRATDLSKQLLSRTSKPSIKVSTKTFIPTPKKTPSVTKHSQLSYPSWCFGSHAQKVWYCLHWMRRWAQSRWLPNNACILLRLGLSVVPPPSPTPKRWTPI